MLSVLLTMLSGKRKAILLEKNGEIACEYTIDEDGDMPPSRTGDMPFGDTPEHGN